MFSKIKSYFFGNSVYTEDQLKEVETQIMIEFEQMERSNNHNNRLISLDRLKSLDAKYKKMKASLYVPS